MSSEGSENMKIPHRKKDMFMPLLFAAAVLLSAICFASHFSGTSTLLSNGLSLITTPLRSATKGIYNLCASANDYFADVSELKKENERLTKENKALFDENTALKGIEKENESLYKALELKKEHNDFKFTNANVISGSSSGYTDIFSIDKGSFHGIKENMPIISDEGVLIGVTYSVEAMSSRCKTLLSYDVNVGVFDENSGETGILSGSFETFADGKYIIKGLSDSTTVTIGDRILTSGLGDIYPRNLVIGTVSGFIPDKGSHTKNAVITPHPSADTNDFVMVITSFKRTYE